MSISKKREQELMALITDVSAELKLAPGDLVLGQDIPAQRPRTTSGILSIDVALGGGIPLDQWIELVGPESSGKTATAMQIVAAQQALDSDWICLWVAAEGFEREFAEMHGVDTDRMLIVEMNSMEEVFEIIVKAMETRAADAFIIDSYPALVPTGEYAREMLDGQMPAVGARLFNQFFRKAQKASRRSLVANDRHWLGIIINQWRDSIGVMFGDPRTTPGGKGKNYSYYVRLDIGRDEWIDNGLKGTKKYAVGQKIRVKVIKNKSGPPQRVAYYDFYFDDHGDFEAGDVDVVSDIFQTAEALGVVERKETGNTYYFLGESIGGNKPAALKNLKKDPELSSRIHKEVMSLVQRKVPGMLNEEEIELTEEIAQEAPKKTKKLVRK